MVVGRLLSLYFPQQVYHIRGEFPPLWRRDVANAATHFGGSGDGVVLGRGVAHRAASDLAGGADPFVLDERRRSLRHRSPIRSLSLRFGKRSFHLKNATYMFQCSPIFTSALNKAGAANLFYDDI